VGGGAAGDVGIVDLELAQIFRDVAARGGACASFFFGVVSRWLWF
jgi:hypothetical protein